LRINAELIKLQGLRSEVLNELRSVSTSNLSSPAERYLEHLDGIFRQEPKFYKEDSLIDGLPGVTSIVYTDIPEKGYTTALTYVLSLVRHRDWKYGRPELCISVESSNLDWAQVVPVLGT